MATARKAVPTAPRTGNKAFDDWLDLLHRRAGGYVGADVTGATDTDKLSSLIGVLDRLGIINDKTT